MADIIDLTEKRENRQAPGTEHVKVDDFGRPMFAFLLEYQMDGEEWGATIWAYDAEDAERRVNGMRETLTLSGQIYSTI